MPFRGLAGRAQEESEREDGFFVTGWRSRESLLAARRGVHPDGCCSSKDRPVALARHPLQQAGPESVERPAHQGWCLDRGPGGLDRPARPDPEHQRFPGRRCRRQRDRHVRGPSRRTPVPCAGAAGEAEAPRQGVAGAVRGARARQRDPRGRSLARREYRARAAPSPRPVSRLSGHARQGHDRGGDRRGLLRAGPSRQAAAAACFGVASAARGLCRRRHDAGAAHGLHRVGRPRPSAAGLGRDQGLLVEGALPDPAHADRDNRPRLGQARGFRRHREL